MIKKLLFVLVFMFFINLAGATDLVSYVQATQAGAWDVVPANLKRATDGNDATAIDDGAGGYFRTSQVAGTYLKWDIGTIQTMKGYRLYMDRQGVAGGCSGVSIEGSTDNVVFTELNGGAYAISCSGAVQHIDYTFDDNRQIRYVRLNTLRDAAVGGSVDYKVWTLMVNLTNTTVANYTFDQGTGVYANDSSGFNINATKTIGSMGWSTNLINGSVNASSLNFDGSTYLTTSNSGGLAPETFNFTYTSPYSVDVWIKTNATPTTSSGVIISKINTGVSPAGYELNLTNGRLYWVVMKTTDANAVVVNTSNVVLSSAYTWYHVLATYNGSSSAYGATIYINGSSVPLSIVTNNAAGEPRNTINVKIGSQTGTNLLNATLDELRIFNYELNATERTNVYQQFQPVPAYPVGGISLSSTSILNTIDVPFLWYDSLYPMDYVDVATDSAFTSIVSSQLTAADTATITLPAGHTYYWRIRQYDPGTGLYGNVSMTQTFNTLLYAGYINVNVVDELTFLPVYGINATLYNSSSAISKYSGITKAYVNFTSSEIIAGQYQLVITPNSTYAERAIIVNSPGNYTVYLPPTSKTIDFVSFYLLDYTGRFPYLNSNLTVTKGTNITHSQYFDSDAKVAVNLIRGEQYTITVWEPQTNDFQQWGNYYSVGTGSVQVIIMDLGVNGSILQPYVQRINASSSSIDVSWLDQGNILNWVNVTIYKDNTSTIVSTINSTSRFGSISYIITDANATYITVVNASTSQGYRTDTNIFSSISQATGAIKNWTYSSFHMPDWVKNAFAIVIMFMLAGSFGAMHRGEGAVVTGILGMFMWWYNILSMNGAILALFGALVFYAVLYALETARRKGSYF